MKPLWGLNINDVRIISCILCLLANENKYVNRCNNNIFDHFHIRSPSSNVQAVYSKGKDYQYFSTFEFLFKSQKIYIFEGKIFFYIAIIIFTYRPIASLSVGPQTMRFTMSKATKANETQRLIC